jgi:hypothetical protein
MLYAECKRLPDEPTNLIRKLKLVFFMAKQTGNLFIKKPLQELTHIEERRDPSSLKAHQDDKLYVLSCHSERSEESRGHAKSLFSKVFIGLFAIILLCGFDFSMHSIPVADIYDGGPGKDGIPAILNPKFISAQEADKTFFKNNDRVLGYVHNGQARAYPIKILNWHEIVNDSGAVVTYCPLCGTGMVFGTEVKGRKLTFGVSGLLYQSDMLLYDHQTESLWSQIKSEAVTGKLMGSRLKLLSSTHTNWAS